MIIGLVVSNIRVFSTIHETEYDMLIAAVKRRNNSLVLCYKKKKLSVYKMVCLVTN